LTPCPRCNGTRFEIVDRDGKEYARPCQCTRREADVDADSFLQRCRIPPRYEECSLACFNAEDHSLRSALHACMEYCNGYPYLGATEEGLGLLFTGTNGVGKTHLAVGVLRELVMEKGASGQFWDFHELIREIKRSFDPSTRTTEVQVLEPVIETDVLLLDDLGAWRMTDWMVDTLFYILNTRYLAKRPTLVTTNFQTADRHKAADPDHFNRRSEFLIDRIGTRLQSRLMEMCAVIHMESVDHREMRQHHNKQVVGLGPPRGPSRGE